MSSAVYNIHSAAIRRALANRCNGKAGLARDDVTANRIEINTAITYTIGGVYFSKAATAALAFSAGHAEQKVGEIRYYPLALDAAGNFITYQGDAGGIVPSDKVPESVCVIGLLKIDCASAVFTHNTTNLNAAGITATFWDLAMLPEAYKP